jgi:ribonuclease P protein component
MGEEFSREEETREENGSRSDNISSRPPPGSLGGPLVRLQDRKTRKDLFADGKKVVSNLLVVYLQANSVGRPRYAVYTGKRLGSAVQRNRVKRLFREALFLKKKMLNPYDFILIPREKAKGLSFHEVASHLDKVLLDNGILKSVQE